MYGNIINIIDEMIEELKRDIRVNIESVKSDNKPNMVSVQNLTNGMSDEKCIKELNKLKAKIKKLGNNKELFVHENVIEGLDTIKYKGGENIDEVLEFLKGNTQSNTFNIVGKKLSHLLSMDYTLVLNGHEITEGSILVKTSTGEISFIPKELLKEKVFTYG